MSVFTSAPSLLDGTTPINIDVLNREALPHPEAYKHVDHAVELANKSQDILPLLKFYRVRADGEKVAIAPWYDERSGDVIGFVDKRSLLNHYREHMRDGQA